MMILLFTKLANHDRSRFPSWSKSFCKNSNEIGVMVVILCQQL